jgi:hypothetical protein
MPSPSFKSKVDAAGQPRRFSGIYTKTTDPTRGPDGLPALLPPTSRRP